MKQVWDLSKLTRDDEVALGDQLHALIVHLNLVREDGSWLQRVKEAAEPLLAMRERKDYPCIFTVLDSDVVFALAHPGDYVYVSRALLELIGEDEDYALQFVLAHELAHLDHQDGFRCLNDPGVQKLNQGTITQFYSLIFPWGYYPAELDFAADRQACVQLLRLGRNRLEVLTFLRKFQSYAKENDFPNGRAKPLLGKGTSLIENHYRAHPAAYDRLKRLQKLLDQRPVKPGAAPAAAPSTKSSR